MNVSSKPSSSSSSSSKSSSTSKSSSSTSKSSSVSKSKSSSSVKPTSKPSSAPKDSFSVSKDVGAKPNANVPNFKSWALSPPAAPQTGAKPAPSDPAPRVAPKPAAPETNVPQAEVKAPDAKAPAAEKPAPPAPKSDNAAYKAFDDSSWATAQARHTAEAAQKAGNVIKATGLANAGTKALTPLNPLASAGGTVAFGKMAYDSYQKGDYKTAALQAGNSAALGGLTAAPFVKGGELLAKGAGRAAPALGGALQAYDGFKNGDNWDKVSGGAKIAGAAMMATGFGAPVGAGLIIGSYMADLGRWGYQKWNAQ